MNNEKEIKYQECSIPACQAAAEAIIKSGIQGGFDLTVNLEIPQATWTPTGYEVFKNTIHCSGLTPEPLDFPESESYYARIVFSNPKDYTRACGNTLKMSKSQVDKAIYEISQTPEANLGFFIEHSGGHFFVTQKYLQSMIFVDRSQIHGRLHKEMKLRSGF